MIAICILCIIYAVAVDQFVFVFFLYEIRWIYIAIKNNYISKQRSFEFSRVP